MTQSVTYNMEGKDYTYTVGDIFEDNCEYGRIIILKYIDGKDMYFDAFLEGENTGRNMYYSHAVLRKYFNPNP